MDMLSPAQLLLMNAAATVDMVGVIGLSTAFQQVPCHHRLARGFDAATHRRLVRTDWLRTIAWSQRGVLAVSMLWLAAAPR